MERLYLDIETYSSNDLPKCGVYKYAEAEDFTVLLLGYSVDGGQVRVVDLANGEELPAIIRAALTDKNVTKVAHNANFERVCLSRFLGLPPHTYLPPSQWLCTMTWSAYLGYPLALADVGEVLGLDRKKLTEGKKLIKYFCIAPRHLPSDAPDRWKLFKLYNKRDVEVEMEVLEKLSHLPVPDFVWDEYYLDQEINDRGVGLDMTLVKNAIRLDTMTREELSERARKLTELDNPNSVQQMKAWLEEQGVGAESLGKKQVKKLVAETDGDVKEVLRLRQQLAKSSVKKYQAMENAVCSDGRARGMFMFYGANRTGRFCLAEGTPVLVRDRSGRIYEKPIESVDTSDEVWDGEGWVSHEGVVFSGDKDVITWDGITATTEHRVFIDKDVAVPLGEAKERRLPIWRGNFHWAGSQREQEGIVRTYDIINAGPRNRFMANGRIVSNSGRLIQLHNLPQNHLPSLAEARALVRNGDVEAVRMLYEDTSDTLSQLVRTAFVPQDGSLFYVADFAAIEARVLSWLANERWRMEVFASGGDIYCATASKMFGVPVEKHGANAELRAKGKSAELACIAEGQLVLTDHGPVPIQKLTPLFRVWDGQEWVSHAGIVFKGFKEAIEYDGLLATPDHLVYSNISEDFIPFSEYVRQRGGRSIYAGIWPVYDVLNAGPRHCFTVSGHLVHNCGYGGSVGALKAMGAVEAGMKEDELKPLVDAWRAASPHIVQLWYDVERAAKDAAINGRPAHVKSLTFTRQAGSLFITLPSGRRLAYVNPRPGSNKFGQQALTYEGSSVGKKWGTIETFGGKLVENCIAEGQLVITDRGRVPIEQVRKDDLVWDGEEWVGHGGVVFRGVQEVLERGGLIATPDHRVYASLDAPPVPLEQYQGCRYAGRQRVYDILNAGPRHRFTVWTGRRGCVVSNCVQAISRDILCYALRSLRGYRICMHVHDEVVIEAPAWTNLERICEVMGRTPPWAPGLQLRADGFVTPWYKKD